MAYRSLNFRRDDNTKLNRYFIFDTAAELLTATLIIGDLAYAVDTKTFYIADTATTFSVVNVTGNAATVTVADAGGDTTTFPLLGTAATGSLAPATDAGLTYNAGTNALTTTTFIGALNGNADTVTTNANLTGVITSVGNATSIASQTGTGTKFVVDTSPTIATPSINTINLTGGQIAFPATQAASANANTLDDYEEGTWTPIDSSGASLTLTTAVGSYVKIGQMVFIAFDVQYPSTVNGSQAVLGGRPFTTAAPANGGAWTGRTGYSSYTTTDIWFYLSNASTTINLYSTAALGALTNATLSTKIIRGTVVYRTTA